MVICPYDPVMGVFREQPYCHFSLFQEEINACAAVHTCYVMDACDRVRSLILLPPMMGDVILPCCANKVDCQGTQGLINLII